MATPTAAGSWKRAVGEEVPLPSGNVALIERPGMEKLLGTGVLPDNLTKIAMEAIEKAQSGGRPQDFKKKGQTGNEIDPEIMAKFMKGENAVSEIFEAFDRVTAMCVRQPVVEWHKRKVIKPDGEWMTTADGKPVYEEIPRSERKSGDEVLYTDEVDLEDKTFIFNFVVGGTRDLETFREEYGDALADVQRREDVELPPE